MTFNRKNRFGLVLIILISASATTGLLFLDPIAQDVNYHRFEDGRQLFGIPNFWNVISNLAFFIVGILGFYLTGIKKISNLLEEIRYAYIALYLGVALVGIGSAYYHLWPNSETLLWDRLPMTISFMALFSIVFGEFVSVRVGKALIIPLLLAGTSSVIYWYVGELNGNGDLRFYILVQFLPIILIPIILLCFQSRFDHTKAYWILILIYIAAKILEHFDAEVFSALGFISGHSLKHIIAAAGLYLLVVSYQRRRLVS